MLRQRTPQTLQARLRILRAQSRHNSWPQGSSCERRDVLSPHMRHGALPSSATEGPPQARRKRTEAPHEQDVWLVPHVSRQARPPPNDVGGLLCQPNCGPCHHSILLKPKSRKPAPRIRNNSAPVTALHPHSSPEAHSQHVEPPTAKASHVPCSSASQAAAVAAAKDRAEAGGERPTGPSLCGLPPSELSLSPSSSPSALGTAASSKAKGGRGAAAAAPAAAPRHRRCGEGGAAAAHILPQRPHHSRDKVDLQAGHPRRGTAPEAAAAPAAPQAKGPACAGTADSGPSLLKPRRSNVAPEGTP